MHLHRRDFVLATSRARTLNGRMKPVQIQLTHNGKAICKLDLKPELQLRLQMWAKANKLTMMKMIERALWFSVGSEEYSNSLDMSAPSEEDIVTFAAALLAA